MAEVTIKVDPRQVAKLGEQFRDAAEVGLQRTVKRGQQHLRAEVPRVTTNLQQGVSGDVDPVKMRGELIVSTRTGRRGAHSATLHLKSGKTRQVTLRPQEAYDYAEVVARGNKDAVLRPKKAKAFLIPVSSAPTGEAYIVDGGQVYVMRQSRKGHKANEYDERAFKKLEPEIAPIFNRALKDVLGAE